MNAPRFHRELPCRGHALLLDGTPLVMGILNITPDSFSDGGNYLDPEKALEQALHLISEGADIIDIGAESTRPGYSEIGPEKEWARLGPVLRPLLTRCPVPVSIDTQRAAVAEKALAAGAHIINDIWGLQKDPAMAEVAAHYQAPVVITHNQKNIRAYASDQELMDALLVSLAKSIEIARRHGLSEDCLIVDPGIGFGKTVEQNLAVLRNLSMLSSLQCPILLGVSRKSVIRKTLAISNRLDTLAEETLAPTIALNVLGLGEGVSIFRVHDIAPNKQALRMAYAVKCGIGFQ